MSIPTFGLESGLRGLRAAQAALDTAGHNVANVNTPGYSRQRVQTAAGDPYTVPGQGHPAGALQIGTGVIARSISQARDANLDQQVRSAYSDQQATLARQSALSEVEEAVGEPGSTGINAAMTRLFNSFHDLSGHPESAGLRNAVVAEAQNAAGVFRRVAGRLENSADTLAGQVTSGVAGVNDAAKRIAALNLEIRKAVAQGDQPNDLCDQRSLLLDQLAQKVNTTVLAQADGTVSVQVGGVALVRGADVVPVAGIADLTSGGDLSSGELRGLVNAQTDVADVRAQLDGLAGAFRDQVNAIQQNGLDKNGVAGVALFTGTQAADLVVNPVVAGDHVAASTNTSPFAAGNGDNALALADLATRKITSGPVAGETLRDFWGGAATQIGVQVKSLNDDAASHDAFVRQFENRREAVSGVSLDEEMADMVRFQRAYQAAARVISMADELTGNLIEMVDGRA